MDDIVNLLCLHLTSQNESALALPQKLDGFIQYQNYFVGFFPPVRGMMEEKKA
jgi:hypothetical protein